MTRISSIYLIAMSAAEGANQPDEAILVLSSFQKEVKSLEDKYQRLLQALCESEAEQDQAALQHLLLLDAAAEETTVGLDQAYAGRCPP